MNTTSKRKIVALLVCLSCLGLAQQQAHAQWVPDRQANYYKSQEEQLYAFDQSLSLLEKANPVADLRAAISKGDTRFVGYKGAGLYIPGVPDKQILYALNHGARFKTLKGSNDVMTENLANRLSRVVQNYMKPYNKALLRYLTNKKPTRRK